MKNHYFDFKEAMAVENNKKAEGLMAQVIAL